MEEKRIFKVTKSKTVHIVTIVVWIIITVLCPFILWQGIKHPIGLLIVVPILAIVISVLVYYHRQSPQYIELTNDALVLHCASGNKVFRYVNGKVSLHVCCVNGEAAVSVVISAGSLEEV